jgi:acetylornithine/N-succinyldiaminopimelate aminotransferase
MIMDEVQSGMGRTGKLFAHEWDNVIPDVMTSAKALGGGLPIGAMLTTEKLAQALPYGTHGSTFGGNPVMCEVARAVLRETLEPGLMDNVVKQGEVLTNALRTYNENRKLFVDVRGKGLMIGAELKPGLKNKAGAIVENCRQQGVLILQAGPNVLRFLPPLNIDDEDLALGIERLRKGLDMPLAG